MRKCQITKKILIVGVGSIGLRHLRCFQSTGRASLSFCEVNPALRAQVAKDQKIDRHYPDLESALADQLRRRRHLHAGQSPYSHGDSAWPRRAFTCCSKSRSARVSTASTSSSEFCKRRKLKSAVAYVMRSNPILRAMKDAIASGRFGRPVEIVSVSGQHFPTFRPAYREIYYKDRATGGGAIQDALTHVLNASEWLVGPIHRIAVDVGYSAAAFYRDVYFVNSPPRPPRQRLSRSPA